MTPHVNISLFGLIKNKTQPQLKGRKAVGNSDIHPSGSPLTERQREDREEGGTDGAFRRQIREKTGALIERDKG